MKLLAAIIGTIMIMPQPSWAETTSFGATEPSQPQKNKTRKKSRANSPSNNVADSATALRLMAKKYESAVAVVFQAKVGVKPSPYCTAFAIAPSTFATNAHCIKRENPKLAFFISLNKKSNKHYRVVKQVAHPRFEESSINFEGQRSKRSIFDVGLLYIDGKVEKYFPMANEAELRKLSAGVPVALIGFPMVNLERENMDIRNPIATMKTGIITSVRDAFLGNSGFKNNHQIQHDMGTAGGASGSPIINTKGQVVGLHNTGAYIGIVLVAEGKRGVLKRIGSAAMVNGAQRVDLLNILLK
jgi:V8-like Glu-specific endopeptidase